MKKSTYESNLSPSKMVDARISELGDWRGQTLAQLRCLILEAAP
ncbi:MAG: DUF1801 domain-containing protein, partial [Anaerolineales bacterium]